MAHHSVRKCCSWVNFRRNIVNLLRHFDALQLIRWSCGWAHCVLKECVLLGYDKWMFRGTTFSTPRILDSSFDRHPLHPRWDEKISFRQWRGRYSICDRKVLLFLVLLSRYFESKIEGTEFLLSISAMALVCISNILKVSQQSRMSYRRLSSELKKGP